MTGTRPRNVLNPEAWVSQAICEPGTGDRFYADNRHQKETVAAKKTCRKCPVQGSCLEVGMYEEYGVWGGFTPEERQLLRRAGRR